MDTGVHNDLYYNMYGFSICGSLRKKARKQNEEGACRSVVLEM